MEASDRDVRYCEVCGKEIPLQALFCSHCGSKQTDPTEEIREAENSKWLRLTAIFFSIDLVVCIVVNFMHFFRGLEWLLITDIVIGLVTLLFLSFIWRHVKALFGWKSFTIPKLLVYSGAAILFALVVNVFVSWLNKTIFYEQVYFYNSFGHLAYPKLAMMATVALLPAVFEELAYRGVILEGLLQTLDEKQAIFIAAFLFAVIHMSFISFFWLLPFAIWLGNIRYKENTIWYGMVIHFCFNATACVLEFYKLNVY